MQQRRLSTLIAVVDHLERRLCGGKSLGDKILSDQEFLETLQLIGHQYVAASASSLAEIPRLQLDDEIQQILSTKPDKRTLSIRHMAMLQVTEVAFRFIESSCNIHSHVYDALQGLQIGFIRTLINDAAALAHPDQPHRKFIEFLVTIFKGYDQYSGRRARALVLEAGRRVAETIIPSKPEAEVCKSSRRALAELLQRYNQETSIYEKTLINKEKGLATRDDVRLFVNREILTAIGNQRLPADLLRFFQDVWSKYLHVTYLREGVESTAWKEGIAIIPTLIRSLSVRDPNEMFQFYQGELGQALYVVHTATDSILHQDPQLIQSVLEYLDAVPLQVIRNETPDLPESEEVPASMQMQNDQNGHAPADCQVADNLQVGDWYIIRTGAQAVRGKLIQKDIPLGYCLFANYSGIKAARLEITGLAQLIADNKLERLDTEPVTEHALETALGQLENQVQRLESKVHSVEQERAKSKAKKLAAKRAASVQTKLLEPVPIQSIPTQVEVEEDSEQIKVLHETISREEIEAHEQERKAADALAQERALEQKHEQELALTKALEDVNMLQPGGWLELITKDNVKHICKLGLKLRSTKKMIFVDRLGQKVAEMRQDELAARMVEGSARIVDLGVAFEDTLQSLILDRSGKINVE